MAVLPLWWLSKDSQIAFNIVHMNNNAVTPQHCVGTYRLELLGQSNRIIIDIR